MLSPLHSYVAPLQNTQLSSVFGINPLQTVELIFVPYSPAGWKDIPMGMLQYSAYSMSVFWTEGLLEKDSCTLQPTHTQ